ncbi:uncharacterized protein LOC132041814 [Lycium ferocissimum]|uniref:uncharacterized protein LOC132041814 n=1 Tax=Lycium ferocissimum TaxID=112874 RepID=UPI00281585C4|nr:uncharacterized protein LOC132041814 [Lycium ferocissimum]
MDKLFVNITHLLDKLTTHNQAWHSNDNESLSYGSSSLAAVAKENHERDHAFAQLQTKVDLLSKKLADKDAQRVNVVEELPPPPPGMYQVPEGMYQEGKQHYEDANYVNNSKGSYQRQNYQGPGHHPWQKPQHQFHGNNYNRNDQGNPNQGNYNNRNYGNKSSNPYILPKAQSSNSQQWRDNSARNSASNAANDSAESRRA